jgi:hypothetical protein
MAQQVVMRDNVKRRDQGSDRALDLSAFVPDARRHTDRN